jgi:hypothetical protein
MRRAAGFAILFIAAGCGNSPHPSEAAPSVISLNAPVRVAASGPALDPTALRVRVGGGITTHESVAELSLQALQLVVVSDGERATLEALELPIADVDITPEGLPPNGLHLRDLRLTAAPTQAEIVHADRDALELRATVALKFTWSMLLADGTPWTLGPATTPPLPLTLQVTRGADGAVTLAASAAHDGVCWAVDGVVSMSDLSLSLAADAALAPSN